MLDKKAFLEGKVGVKVFCLEQEQYIIDLALENKFLTNEVLKESFEKRTYIKYPYFYIEKGEELQASMYKDYDDCVNYVSFEEIFGELN